FDLVCNDEYWAEHSSSLFMLGALLIPVFTHLSDLYGRRKLFLFTLWVASITAIACSMAPTIITFLACRFILGVATAILDPGSIYCCLGTGDHACWYPQNMDIKLEMALLHNIYPKLLPESPYWSISHNKQHAIEHKKEQEFGSDNEIRVNSNEFEKTQSLFYPSRKHKPDELIRYIENACHYNKVNIDVSKCEMDLQQPDEQHGSRSIMDILRHKVALFHLIVQCYVVAAMNISYWGMALLSTTLSEDSYTGYFLSGLIELPGGLLAVVFLLKFGRRSISIWSFFMQSLLYFMIVLFPGIGTMQMVLAVTAKFFNSFIWVAQPLMLAEMSPTTIRNTFYGIVQFFAEIGSIAAPYLPLLKNINPGAPQAAVAVFSFTAALFLLTAPETKDRPMPEDLDQFDPGCFLQMFDYRMQKKRDVLIAAKDIEETSPMTQMQPE
ncbi:unnamed protein product, partial [Onchocerca ochengi]|uniref:MFS domain-containing protein n=1 Tax=Onchocerca ochengi TaxID=42157 RepID=A0A182EBN0_ONCOC